MKYLYTFAVVTCEFYDQADLPGRDRTHAEVDWAASCLRVETWLYDAIRTETDSIAYFRSVMDGWDATHRQVAPWVTSNRPDASTELRRSVERDLLLIHVDDVEATGLLPRPTEAELRRWFPRESPGHYAVRAFFNALYDAFEFVFSGRTVFTAVGRCIGATRDDSEYGGPGGVARAPKAPQGDMAPSPKQDSVDG